MVGLPSGAFNMKICEGFIPPPELRLCERHLKPINPSRWINRCRKVGCRECTEDLKNRTSVPISGNRACIRHKKPITPSSWKQGHRTTGCSDCIRERANSTELVNSRIQKWKTSFITCRNHPERRCNLARFKNNASRLCSSCNGRRYDGTAKPSRINLRNKASYKKSMTKRNKLGASGRSMNVLQIWERCTGMLAEFPRRVNG